MSWSFIYARCAKGEYYPDDDGQDTKPGVFAHFLHAVEDIVFRYLSGINSNFSVPCQFS